MEADAKEDADVIMVCVLLMIRTQEKTGPGGQIPLENCSGYKKR